MLLSVYQDALKQAMISNDPEEAIFQIHLMIQADPFDQRKIIADALEDFLMRYPETEQAREFAERMQTQVEQLEAQEGTQSDWNGLMGEMLHGIESMPSLELCESIQEVANELEKLGALQRNVYPASKKSTSSTSSSRRQPPRKKGRHPTSNNRKGIFGGLKDGLRDVFKDGSKPRRR
mgnify:CR=1 FL=1